MDLQNRPYSLKMQLDRSEKFALTVDSKHDYAFSDMKIFLQEFV